MQNSDTSFEASGERSSAPTTAAYLTRVQFLHALLVYPGIFAMALLHAPFLDKGWAYLVLAWPFWMLRLIRRNWRGGWLGIALTVVPSIVWPYIPAALTLGARM